MSDTEKVLNAFISAGKPLKNAEIAELSGLDKNKVAKIIKSLQDEGKIYSPKKFFFDLK